MMAASRRHTTARCRPSTPIAGAMKDATRLGLPPSASSSRIGSIVRRAHRWAAGQARGGWHPRGHPRASILGSGRPDRRVRWTPPGAWRPNLDASLHSAHPIFRPTRSDELCPIDPCTTPHGPMYAARSTHGAWPIDSRTLPDRPTSLASWTDVLRPIDPRTLPDRPMRHGRSTHVPCPIDP
jgi:hypothetical protein